MKTAINDKIHEFSRLPNYYVPRVMGIEIILGAKNRVPMKMARNDKIHEFC